MKSTIIFLLLFTGLLSCGHSDNFLRQKYTHLKKIDAPEGIAITPPCTSIEVEKFDDALAVPASPGIESNLEIYSTSPGDSISNAIAQVPVQPGSFVKPTMLGTVKMLHSANIPTTQSSKVKPVLIVLGFTFFFLTIATIVVGWLLCLAFWNPQEKALVASVFPVVSWFFSLVGLSGLFFGTNKFSGSRKISKRKRRWNWWSAAMFFLFLLHLFVSILGLFLLGFGVLVVFASLAALYLAMGFVFLMKAR